MGLLLDVEEAIQIRLVVDSTRTRPDASQEWLPVELKVPLTDAEVLPGLTDGQPSLERQWYVGRLHDNHSTIKTSINIRKHQKTS